MAIQDAKQGGLVAGGQGLQDEECDLGGHSAHDAVNGPGGRIQKR